MKPQDILKFYPLLLAQNPQMIGFEKLKKAVSENRVIAHKGERLGRITILGKHRGTYQWHKWRGTTPWQTEN